MTVDTSEVAFDPRDPEQRLEDPSTWKGTTNPVLLMASLVSEVLADADGFWPRVAELATMAEAPVSGEVISEEAAAALLSGETLARLPKDRL